MTRPALPTFLLLGLAFGGALTPPGAQAQMLEGCRLQDGTLQCVPGMTADPQEQIRILRSEISEDLRLEAAAKENIDGLREVVLEGEAIEGALLSARLAAAEESASSPIAYHWYRRNAAGETWILISSATGPTYTIGSADVGERLMVVVVVKEGDGVRRVASGPFGPVRQAE